jgi:hypothetical protein
MFFVSGFSNAIHLGLHSGKSLTYFGRCLVLNSVRALDMLDYKRDFTQSF